VIIQRRSVRYCKNPNCNCLLRQREGESMAKFILRKYCTPECSKGMKGDNRNVCFCGTPRDLQHIPFCSWDCRLIAIKCKRWGIEPDMKEYAKKAQELYNKQREIDIRCRPDQNVYLA
jgi:hypothetical protein